MADKIFAYKHEMTNRNQRVFGLFFRHPKPFSRPKSPIRTMDMDQGKLLNWKSKVINKKYKHLI